MNTPFHINDRDDRTSASDRKSRYGAYLALNLDHFREDPADPTLITDCVAFTSAAWRLATRPTMSPGYVTWGGRILAATCDYNGEDGSLIAGIDLATPPPAALDKLTLPGIGRWAGWDHHSTYGYCEPSERALTLHPAVLTTTRVLLPFRPDQLHLPAPIPATEPDQLTHEAKAAVRKLVDLLNGHIGPIIGALDN